MQDLLNSEVSICSQDRGKKGMFSATMWGYRNCMFQFETFCKEQVFTFSFSLIFFQTHFMKTNLSSIIYDMLPCL